MTDITFDILARDKASSTFNKVGSSAEKSTGHLHSFGSTLAKVGGAFAVFEGIKKGAEFLGDATKAAMTDQAAQKSLTLALKNTTDASGKQIAGINDWLGKQSEAVGITKDQLQPAFQHLAESSGSVGKAQKELKIAMDASAGTGRSLASVSQALVKANNGSVGGLARFGIATKNADGTTKTLHETLKGMSKTFAGQAKAHAETFAGTMGRLKATFHEVEIAIGDKLIPILTRFGNWLIEKGIPGAKKIGETIGNNLSPIIDKLKQAFDRMAPVLVTVGNFMKKNPAVVKTFAVVLGVLAGAIALVSGAMAVLDAVMAANPFVLAAVAIAALAAAFVYAYKHSEKFRTIVQGAMAGVKAAINGVKTVMTTFVNVGKALWAKFGASIMSVVKTYFGALKAVIGGYLKIVQGVIKVITSAIHGDWSGVWAGLKQIVDGAFQAIAGVVRAQLAVVMGLVKGLPGKIKSAVGNLGSLLLGAGKAIIQGLIDGIGSMIHSLTDKLHSITKLIPIHKGPLDDDKKLLRPAGQAIMQGLIDGIADKVIPLQSALSKVTGLIAKVGDKIAGLQSTRAGFQSTFTADSIFGTDLSDGGGINDLIAAQQAQADQAKQLAADVGTVTKKGLSKALVRQLQSQGTAGAAALHALATGSSAQIARLNALDKQTSASLQSAGMRAGNYVRGGSINADIRRAQHQDRILERLEHSLHDLAQTQKKGETIVVEIDGEAVISAIKRRNKRKGVKSAGV